MKVLTGNFFAVAAGLLLAGAAPAQVLTTNGFRPVPVPVTRYAPIAVNYPPGYAQPAYYESAYSGYFNGLANLTAAQGQYYQDVNQARLMNQQVEQGKIDLSKSYLQHKMWEESLKPTPEQLRERERQQQLLRALDNPPLTEITSGLSLNELQKNIKREMDSGTYGPTVPIEEDVLRQINVLAATGGNVSAIKDGGKLKWPFLLRDTPYDKDRKQFAQLWDKALKDVQSDDLTPQTIRDMTSILNRMEAQVDKSGTNISFGQSIEARRYIGELKSNLTALTDPNAGNYFNNKWTAKGRDVAELIRNMNNEGLRFGPAGRGEETAYKVLHSAMVTYERSTQQVRR